MSLFSYKVLIEGGKEKTGRITGKTQKEAQEQLAKRNKIVDWISIKEETTHETPINQKPDTTPISSAIKRPKNAVTTKPKPLSKLSKMLYLQGGLCFFCGEPLSEEDASIEHLNPKSKGGSSTDDNEVICHKSLNETFGNMGLKQKFEFTLKSAGHFKCP